MPLHTRKQFISWQYFPARWWLRWQSGATSKHTIFAINQNAYWSNYKLFSVHCSLELLWWLVCSGLTMEKQPPTMCITSINAFCVIIFSCLIAWELLPLVNLLARTSHTRTRIQMDTWGRHFPWKPFNNYCEHSFFFQTFYPFVYSREFVAFVNNARIARAHKSGCASRIAARHCIVIWLLVVLGGQRKRVAATRSFCIWIYTYIFALLLEMTTTVAAAVQLTFAEHEPERNNFCSSALHTVCTLCGS